MQIIMYAISISLILFGFIALLKQKTYIDNQTKEPTAIVLSFWEKSGPTTRHWPLYSWVCNAVFTFQKSTAREKGRWAIQSQMIDSTDQIDDWRQGGFKLYLTIPMLPSTKMPVLTPLNWKLIKM